MFVSFNSKTTGVISGERTVYPVEAHEFILGFKWSSLYNVLSTTGYTFGIFNISLINFT